jgi:uncharacterized protein YndB with AHSA1/START domain
VGHRRLRADAARETITPDVTQDPQELSERFEQHLVIAATPAVVFGCFFAAEALRSWWQAVRSVTTPVPLGVFAVEWATTPYRDELLGSLGGVFHGTVVDVRPGEHFFVADAYWIPPEGDPIGPMALQVTCEEDPGGCRLHVRQDGYDESERWRRYYAVVSRGWQISLTALKRYAESPPKARGPAAQ